MGLYDPSQRPTQLQAGVPQDGVAAPHGVAHYSLRVSGAHAISLAVVPLSSTDVDLYVKLGAGLPASPSSHDFASADALAAGGDVVRRRRRVGEARLRCLAASERLPAARLSGAQAAPIRTPGRRLSS